MIIPGVIPGIYLFAIILTFHIYIINMKKEQRVLEYSLYKFNLNWGN
jgi:hypothetical protein